MLKRLINLGGKETPDVSVEYDLYNADARGVPILFSSGFMTEGSDRWIAWLQSTLPNHPIYHIVWASHNSDAVAKHLKHIFGAHLLRKAGLGGWLRRKIAVNPYSKAAITAFDLALILNDVRRFWRNTIRESEKVGMYTGNLIQNRKPLVDGGPPLDRFSVIGHSLGARLVMNLLDQVDEKNRAERVILAAAALDRSDKIWKRMKSLPHPVQNVYCRDDKILKYLYRLGNLSGKTAAGIAAVKQQHVDNLEVTEQVTGHTQYADNDFFTHWLAQYVDASYRSDAPTPAILP